MERFTWNLLVETKEHLMIVGEAIIPVGQETVIYGINMGHLFYEWKPEELYTSMNIQVTVSYTHLRAHET